MDSDGIPLAFSIHSGNTNEQLALQPLEKKILEDFSLAKFVICTDAGLSSTDNCKFNNLGKRALKETYDGFYAVCTSLEDDAPAITKINHNHWEIEKCFRLPKKDFKARPVYLNRDDRIKAYFMHVFYH